MTGQWHPDETALAEYRAGLTGGRRARRLAAHVASCERCASVNDQLAAVTTALASAPDPAMPDAVERRIMAALATEAAHATEAPRETEAARGTAPRRPSRGRSGPGGHRWLRPAMLASAVAACLVLFGGVYGLTHLSSGSSSSSASSSAAGNAAAGSESSPLAGAQTPGTHAEPANPVHADFSVTASGTSYQPATLAEQVRAELAKPAKTAPQPADAAAPSARLAGCVLHVTGQERPSLVDRATYQGKPAYVIAVANRAWVVGTGCTASNPELMASVGL